jgi:hypothetical protein
MNVYEFYFVNVVTRKEHRIVRVDNITPMYFVQYILHIIIIILLL